MILSLPSDSGNIFLTLWRPGALGSIYWLLASLCSAYWTGFWILRSQCVKTSFCLDTPQPFRCLFHSSLSDGAQQSFWSLLALCRTLALSKLPAALRSSFFMSQKPLWPSAVASAAWILCLDFGCLFVSLRILGRPFHFPMFLVNGETYIPEEAPILFF